jgi:hypothetical protein
VLQLQRWQHKRPQQASEQQGRRTRRKTAQQQPQQTVEQEADTIQSSNQHSLQDRPQLVLTLQDASEQPAAMAVLEALYATKPLPELLSVLMQEQQLQAAVLADMWQVSDVSAAVVDQLIEAAKAGKLSEAAEQQLLHMPAQPACLQPLLKHVLLSVFGDLETVWATDSMRLRLLGLPLPAMELLLSCDELKVGAIHLSWPVTV